MKVHLIDGTYELFRSYYGAPSATAPSGAEVGASRGLMRSLLSLLREDEVTHVAIAFDTVIESFRNQLFAGYKTGQGIDPALWAQFPVAEKVAAALGITVWPMIEFEADDALATAAAIASDDPRVSQVVICSADKDLLQCVRGERVVCRDRRRRLILDESGVVAKMGVSPASIPDYLALVGDSADGIPGVPRWGAKSTATVLARYRHIENIPADASDWDVAVRGAAGLAESLEEHRSDAELYLRLATLRLDVPLGQGVDDWQWRGPDEGLSALCAELGEEDLSARAGQLAR